MENKNGQGIFYGVIGVATLVVAIIGATFAYFSAATETTYTNNIAGGTLDVGGSNLSLTVQRVTFDGKTEGINDNLVPAVIDEDHLQTSLQAAVTADCENLANDYTGCHVYRVTAHTANTLTGVTVEFNTMEATAASVANWKYAVYQGNTEKNVTTLTSASAQVFGATGSGTSFKALDAGTLTGGTGTAGDTVWYLIVYLKNTNNAQNNTGETGATNETGNYSGLVSLSVAGGGEVKASFSA